MAVRLAVLFGCCLFGAISGWAAALAVAQPGLLQGERPGPTLLAYGAVALFGAGYLLGSSLRGRRPRATALRAASVAAGVAFAAKALVPALAPWTVVLIAAGVSGVLAGLVRTRRDGGSRPAQARSL
jgi:hypothetical protein